MSNKNVEKFKVSIWKYLFIHQGQGAGNGSVEGTLFMCTVPSETLDSTQNSHNLHHIDKPMHNYIIWKNTFNLLVVKPAAEVL
jgi:hypothetical protein